MLKAYSRNTLMLIFSPISIVLIVLALIFFIYPYDYFEGNQTTNILAGIFPIALVILFPISLLLKLFLSKNVKQLWIIETIGLGLILLSFWTIIR
jgi:hypothetical protein